MRCTTRKMHVGNLTGTTRNLYFSVVMIWSLVRMTVCQDILITPGGVPTVLIFSHFTPGIKIRDMLAETKNANQWLLGDTVQVFENGHAGQNPTIFVYTGTNKWAPSNVNPEHRIDSVYKITRAITSTGNILMPSLAAGSTALPTVRNCTLSAGLGYIRKSTNALNIYSPMAMRLNNIMDAPDSTVTILYS